MNLFSNTLCSTCFYFFCCKIKYTSLSTPKGISLFVFPKPHANTHSFTHLKMEKKQRLFFGLKDKVVHGLLSQEAPCEIGKPQARKGTPVARGRIWQNLRPRLHTQIGKVGSVDERTTHESTLFFLILFLLQELQSGVGWHGRWGTIDD